MPAIRWKLLNLDQLKRKSPAKFAEQADLLAQRFDKAMRRLGLNRREGHALDCSAFCPPGGQMPLF